MGGIESAIRLILFALVSVGLLMYFMAASLCGTY